MQKMLNPSLAEDDSDEIEQLGLEDIGGTVSKLRVSRATVFRLIRSGHLPIVKIRRRTFTTREGRAALIDRCQRGMLR